MAKAATLLRKIQKGASSVKTGESKFSSFNFGESGRIQMFKKREIVQPYLHPIDSRLVNTQIEKAIVTSLQSAYPSIKEDYSSLLPTHLVNDLYSLYYNPANRMKFEGLDKTNKIKFNILDSINNSLIKIVTNNSHIGSYIYTEEISRFLYKKFKELPPEQQKDLKEALDRCNQEDEQSSGKEDKDSGTGNSPSNEQDKFEKGVSEEDQFDYANQDSQKDSTSSKNVDKTSRGVANNSHGNNTDKDNSQEAANKIDTDLKKMVDDLTKNLQSDKSQKELQQALSKAEEKLDKLKSLGINTENDEEMPEEEKREIIKSLNSLDFIRASLSKLNTSKDKIVKAVKKILDGTTNYFSQKHVTREVELFEADDIIDINGIELLHPIFRNSRLFDLSITERKYIGKFDLFIDVSGSMSSGCGGDLNGVARIDLAKSLAMQMKELGILGDLYEFEDKPKKIMNTDISILMMQPNGGTNIENVMKTILKTGNNSVVLSDGESHVETYSHKVLFIGVGTDFKDFKSDHRGTGGIFVEKNQCIHYNGKEFVETKPLVK